MTQGAIGSWMKNQDLLVNKINQYAFSYWLLMVNYVGIEPLVAMQS